MLFNNNSEKKVYNYEIMAFPNKNLILELYGTYPKEAAQKAFTFYHL